MKLKVLCIIFTLVILLSMWNNSPLKKEMSRVEVEVALPKRENIYNTVVARGTVVENNKTTLRLDKSAVIDRVYVKVGEYVSEGTPLFDVSEKDGDLEDVVSVANMFPTIDNFTDIEHFYTAKSTVKTVDTLSNIVSPISGMVTELSVEDGDFALGKMPIISISDFDDLQVSASVSELNIKSIQIGQKVEVTGEAFAGETYIAVVNEISPKASKNFSLTGTSETTIEVNLKVLSENTKLRPGYNVTAKIFTDSHVNSLTLPYDCIFQEKSKEYVYTIKDGAIYKRAIRTGYELDNRVEIVAGISDTDIIVKNPKEEFYDKMLVKVGG